MMGKLDLKHALRFVEVSPEEASDAELGIGERIKYYKVVESHKK